MSTRPSRLVLVLALAFAADALASDFLVATKPNALDPSGCMCVKGKTIGEARRDLSLTDGPMLVEPQEFAGFVPSRVTFKHRANPASPTYNSDPLSIPTSNSWVPVNYLEITHTAEIDPVATGLQVWGEVQFQLMIAPTSVASGSYVGLAYDIWVTEDTNGNGTYGDVGDAQGYLEQTYNGPWLHTTNSTSHYVTSNITHSFRMSAKSARFRLEIYGIHTGTTPGSIQVNYGWGKVSSGIKLP